MRAYDLRRAGLLGGCPHGLDRGGIVVPYVEGDVSRADGERRDARALYDDMGTQAQERLVHEHPGVAFRGVDHHVLEAPGRLQARAPLPARRKAGAALAAQPAGLELGHDGLGNHTSGSRERRVAARRTVGRDVRRVVWHGAGEKERRAVHAHRARLGRTCRHLGGKELGFGERPLARVGAQPGRAIVCQAEKGRERADAGRAIVVCLGERLDLLDAQRPCRVVKVPEPLH